MRVSDEKTHELLGKIILLNGEILAELRDIHRTLRGIEYISAQTFYEVQAIKRILLQKPHFPTHFTIRSTTMALPEPGATLTSTATPEPAGSSLGTVIPVWSSDDTTDVTVTADPTGLIATIVLSAAIAIGKVVTLTVSATDPATGNLATGTTSFTVVAPPAVFPTSFSLSTPA
jgi:hypothetical protein